MPRRSLALFAIAALMNAAVVLESRATGAWIGDHSIPSSDGHMIDALALGDSLVVAGEFLHVGQIAAHNLALWDGHAWSEFEGGANGAVNGLTRWHGDLVAAGAFTEIGGVAARHVARWDGTRWEPLDIDWPEDGFAFDVGSDGTSLVVAGTWLVWTPDQVWYTSVHQRVDDTWQPADVGAGTWDPSLELLVDADGGLAATWHDDESHRVSEWLQDHWEPLTTPPLNLDSPEMCYVDRETRLAAGYRWNGRVTQFLLLHEDSPGRWSSLGEAPGGWIGHIARYGGDPVVWNGSRLYSVRPTLWRDLGLAARAVTQLRPWGDRLIALGGFTQVPPLPYSQIVSYDGARWSTFGPPYSGDGADDRVETLLGDGDHLIARGWFRRIGALPVQGVAELRAGTWTASQLPAAAPFARLLSLREGEVLLARQTSLEADEVGYWNGENFNSIGLCAGGTVEATAEFEGRVIIGGSFTSVQGRNAGEPHVVNRVAAFDGLRWEDMGAGLNLDVGAMIRCNEELIAAGSIREGPERGWLQVARWRDGRWVPMGDPLPYASPHLGFAAGRLYVAGTASPVSGGHPSFVARWDTGHWTIVGDFTIPIHAVASYNGRLIVGGGEQEYPDSFRVLLRAFDGAAWRELGEGVDRPVWALGATDDALWVGGDFLTAGEQAASRIATWHDEFTPVTDLRGELRGDEAHLEWRAPNDPAFAGCIVRWSTEYGIRDAGDGLPLGKGELLTAQPGEVMRAVVPVTARAEGASLAVFAVDYSGLYSRASRIDVTIPDTEPPVLSLSVTALRDNPGAVEIRVGASEELKPETIALDFAGARVEIESTPVGRLAWRGIARREVKGVAALRVSAEDLSGHLGSTHLDCASNRLIWSGDSTLVSPDGNAAFEIPAHSVDARQYAYIAEEAEASGARTYHLSVSSRLNLPFTARLSFDPAAYDSSELASLVITRDGTRINSTRLLDRHQVTATSLADGRFRLDPPPHLPVVDEPPPSAFHLKLPMNPCIGAVPLELALDQSASARVAIYDLEGREVRRVLESSMPAGVHELWWDGRDAQGRSTPAGIYFVRATSHGRSAVLSVCRLK